MIIYLIKSTFCLALFFAFYRLALEREKMHVFKRVYLLSSICFALCIPFVEIKIKNEAAPFAAHTALQAIIPVNGPVEQGVQSPIDQPAPKVAAGFEHVFLTFIFTVYIVVACILSFRFVRNIWHLHCTIRKNEQIGYQRARLVLIDKPILPHTFLHYILIGKADYLGRQIDEPLLKHELTHARQRHSIDILCIELLLIVFWFHPLLYLYKRAIKLNHEFLADSVAICSSNTISDYQYMLLNRVFLHNASPLTSQLDYLLTRKRLTMMTRQTSALRAFIIKAALVPLSMGLVFALATRTVAQQTPAPQKPATKPTLSPKPTPAPEQAKSVESDSLRRIKYLFYKDAIFPRPDKNGKIVKKKYSDLTAEEIAKLAPPPPVRTSKQPTQVQLDEWLDAKKFGVWLDDKRVSNEQLKKYKPADFGDYFVSRLEKNAINYGKHYFQVNVYTQKAFEANRQAYIKKLELDK